ncbi:MAG: ATP-binding cassette domain-containing protein [Woeseiaceae bacterium]
MKGIDLVIEPKTTTAVIGESGSGKSTLLRLLNGMQPADSGSVTRQGRPITSIGTQALRQNTGYAMQQIGLYPHRTIRENIALPLQLAGRVDQNSAQLVTSLARQLQLNDAQLDRYPTELSGGQQQRAGLCRALILQPDLLLLDEAFSGLDAITRSHALDAFLALKARTALTTVLVTHDLNEARKVADHLVVLYEGKIVRQGPKADVLQNPSHPYAAALIKAFS